MEDGKSGRRVDGKRRERRKRHGLGNLDHSHQILLA